MAKIYYEEDCNLSALEGKTIAVIGPNADDVELLNGNYGGTPIDAHK